MAIPVAYQVISHTPVVVNDGGVAISYQPGQTFFADPQNASVRRLLTTVQIIPVVGSAPPNTGVAIVAGPPGPPGPPGPTGGGGGGPWTDIATVVQLGTPTDSVLIQSGKISSPGGTNSEQYGNGAIASGQSAVSVGRNATSARDGTTLLGEGSFANGVNDVVIGLNARDFYLSGSVEAVLIGHSAQMAGANGSVGIGASVDLSNQIQVVIGQFASSNGFASLAFGWEADANSNKSIALGPRSLTTADHQFSSGHLNYEIFDAYFGGGVQIPETNGRWAQQAPHFTLHGSGGQAITPIADPATPPTLSLFAPGIGTFAAGTYAFAYIWRNKDADGETLISPIDSFTTALNDSVRVVTPSLPAGAQDIAVYCEDTPGSGNLYFVGAAFSSPIIITSPPPVGGGPNNPVIPPANTTASNGHGWDLRFAGGDSDDATLPGGNISFYTNRIGTAHSLSFAGFFNGADGSFSVPGVTQGDQSERFGLNAMVTGLYGTAVGANAHSAARSVVIGRGAQQDPAGGSSVLIGYNSGLDATAGNSVVIGWQAQGHGNGSVGIGLNTNVNGGIAIGTQALDVNNTVVIGNNASAGNATGLSIVTIGHNSNVGLNAASANLTAVGGTTTTEGTWGVVIGTASGTQHPASHDYVMLGASNAGFFTAPFNNSFVCGAPGHSVTDVWFGTGPKYDFADAGPVTDYTIHGSEGQTGFPNGGKLKTAGGRGLTASDHGGNLEYYTARDTTATTLTLAGFFNAADGSFSVPGQGGVNSERHGLNADALGDRAIALGFQTIARGAETIAIGARSSVGGFAMTLVSAVGFSQGDVVNDGAGATGVIIGPGASAANPFGTNLVIYVTSGTWAASGTINDTTSANSTTYSAGTFTLPDDNILIGADSFMVGVTPSNSGEGNIAIGSEIQMATDEDNNVAIGSEILFTSAAASIAIGNGVVLQSLIADANLIGIGTDVQVSGRDNIAIGDSAVVNGPTIESIVIGHGATAANTGQHVAVGASTRAFGFAGVAIGNTAQAGVDGSSSDCIAIGDGATAGTVAGHVDCIAIGDGATAEGVSCTALGESTARGVSSCHALGGSQAGNGGSDANITVVGESTATGGSFLYSLGDNNTLHGTHNVAVGDHLFPGSGVNHDIIAIGRATSISGISEVIAIGHDLSFNGITTADLIAIGHNSTVGNVNTNKELIGIGHGLTITGENSVAVGHSASVTGNWAVALGNNAQATQFFAIGVGGLTEAFGLKSIAIGSDDVLSTKAHGDYSVVIGCQATDNTNVESISIGHTAQSGNIAATGSELITIGHSAHAGGGAGALKCIAVGRASVAGPTAADSFCISIGDAASTTGTDSLAMGRSATSVTQGLAIGSLSQAAFAGAIAIGVPFSGTGTTAQGVNAPGGGGVFPMIAIGLGAQVGPAPGTAITNTQTRISDCIGIGDGVEAGFGVGPNSDCIAIGDGSTAGGFGGSDINCYSDQIAIGDGSSAGGVSNNSPTTVATGNGATVTFSGTLAGAPFPKGPSGGMLVTYTIGGVTQSGQAGSGGGFSGTHIIPTSFFTYSSGAWQVHFDTAPDNGTPIQLTPNFGGSDLIAMGDGATSSGSDCIAIGDGAEAGTGRVDHDIIAIGNGADGRGTGGVAGHDIICFGSANNQDAHGNFLNNVFVAGSPNNSHFISDVYFGSGIGFSSNLAPVSTTIHGSGGSSSTFQNGADISIAGGVGFNAGNQGGNVHLKIAVDGAATTLVDGLQVQRNGNVLAGLSTTAAASTNGFLYIPAGAGPPSGSPAIFSGFVPLWYDTANNKLYANNAGWKTTTVFA